MNCLESNVDNLEIKLIENKEYFDNMFRGIDDKILLDEQQRNAILLDAKNILVIAGAGSGKTTTMVAKAVYLIEKENYKQEDIVIISFTRKVKEEIMKLLHENFGYTGVNVTTFHALGLKIINSSGYNYKKIVEDSGKFFILKNYITDVLFKDKKKFNSLLEAFGKYFYFDDKWKEFSSFNDYLDYLYKSKMKNSKMDIAEYNRTQTLKRREYKKTIKGEYLRSKEEVDIANFLYINGINYEYEKRFDNVENYYPDFFIEQLEKTNYIEHFGVDENGRNDMHTEDELRSYLRTMKIKQQFFNENFNRNLFIVTYSKYNNGSTYLKELVNELKIRGYYLNRRTEEEIYERLKETSRDGYVIIFIEKILIPFIKLYKEQGYTVSDFDQLIKNEGKILENQLLVLKDFFVYYQNALEEKRLIDFEDMLHKSCYLMSKINETILKVDYKYLIIDEYQDISDSRLNLVKKMSELFDAKVMAVGDDWQTIFGYSGSRIDLFKNFEREMENAERVAIEKTYRNSQELIDIAGGFIQRNPDQIEKKLISSKHLQNPIELIVYDDSDKELLNNNRSFATEKILDEIVGMDANSRILFMGRYKKDVWKISNNERFRVFQKKVVSKKHPKLQIDYLTIHQAKGCGYDYCILLDLNDNTYGFPSKIEDLPIIKIIKPKIVEPIDYPEERRLFYVALTRTKNKIYILVPKSKASAFAYEIEKYTNVIVRGFKQPTESEVLNS